MRTIIGVYKTLQPYSPISTHHFFGGASQVQANGTGQSRPSLPEFKDLLRQLKNSVHFVWQTLRPRPGIRGMWLSTSSVPLSSSSSFDSIGMSGNTLHLQPDGIGQEPAGISVRHLRYLSQPTSHLWMMPSFATFVSPSRAGGISGMGPQLQGGIGLMHDSNSGFPDAWFSRHVIYCPHFMLHRSMIPSSAAIRWQPTNKRRSESCCFMVKERWILGITVGLLFKRCHKTGSVFGRLFSHKEQGLLARIH